MDNVSKWRIYQHLLTLHQCFISKFKVNYKRKVLLILMYAGILLIFIIWCAIAWVRLNQKTLFNLKHLSANLQPLTARQSASTSTPTMLHRNQLRCISTLSSFLHLQNREKMKWDSVEKQIRSFWCHCHSQSKIKGWLRWSILLKDLMRFLCLVEEIFVKKILTSSGTC